MASPQSARWIPSGHPNALIHDDRTVREIQCPGVQDNPRNQWSNSVRDNNAEARAIIEQRLAGDGEYLFPSPRDAKQPLGDQLPLWYAIRKEAGLDDVRPHDLRHTFASNAVMQGTPLPVVARLLGHSQTTMTLRYAHTGDRETEAAAERVGGVISRLLSTSSVG